MSDTERTRTDNEVELPVVGFVTDKLSAVAALLVGLLFLALFVLSGWQIILRNFIGGSWRWIPAYSRLMFIWMVFLGAAVLYKRNEHLVMTFLLHRMPRKVQTVIGLVMHIALSYMFLEMILFGLRVTETRMRIRFDTWPLATGYAYAAVPVAATLLLVFGLEKIAEHIVVLRRVFRSDGGHGGSTHGGSTHDGREADSSPAP